MKVCGKCLNEFDGKDGENNCGKCRRNSKRRSQRAELKAVYESLGLKRVRGALGGTYFE